MKREKIIILGILAIVVISVIYASTSQNKKCESNIICQDWSNCINNEKSRICIDANKCSENYTESASCDYTCTPDWKCTSWSECDQASHTRTCIDINNCHITTDKPLETESCITTCIPNWTCTSWNTCNNNVQTRICTDTENCNDLSDKPEETMTCSNQQYELVKSQYQSYFNSNPRIFNAVNHVLDYRNKLNYDFTSLPNWDIIYKYLQAEEEGNNTGTAYDENKVMAHSIYVDKHNLVPWRLNDYDDEALKIIFSPIQDASAWDGIYGSYSHNPLSVMTCNPKITYDYAKNFVRTDPKQSSYAIVDYMRRFRHELAGTTQLTSGCDENMLTNPGVPGDLIPEPQLSGCHASAQLIVDLARSINIPAFYHYNLWCDNWLLYGHGSVAFYKIGYLPHGDDVYPYVHPELSSCQLIIPWDYFINNILTLKCRNPNKCDNPCNCLHSVNDPFYGCGYYDFGTGYNPGYSAYDRSSTVC